MRRVTTSLLLLALALAPGARAAGHGGNPTADKDHQPQKCFEIRGRAILYRGDGFFAIWHVGTHHIFYPADKASFDLLCNYMDCKNPRQQPALFADMTVCPTEPYRKGWAQPVVVKRVTHASVVPEWPPARHK